MINLDKANKLSLCFINDVVQDMLNRKLMKVKECKAMRFDGFLQMSEESVNSQWAWPKEGAHNDYKPVYRVELRVRGWASSSERESLT